MTLEHFDELLRLRARVEELEGEVRKLRRSAGVTWVPSENYGKMRAVVEAAFDQYNDDPDGCYSNLREACGAYHTDAKEVPIAVIPDGTALPPRGFVPQSNQDFGGFFIPDAVSVITDGKQFIVSSKSVTGTASVGDTYCEPCGGWHAPPNCQDTP